jgi:hypothetical protein
MQARKSRVRVKAFVVPTAALEGVGGVGQPQLSC